MADKVIITQVHNTVVLLENLTIQIDISIRYQDSNGVLYNFGEIQRTLELKNGPVFKTHQQLNNEIALLGRAEVEAIVEPVGVLAGEYLVSGFSVTTV